MNGKIEHNFKQTAATLAEALPYIQRYEDSTIVIKLGGHAMTSKPSMENFARDIVLIKQCGVNPVIVHGGGPMINKVLSDLKIEKKGKTYFFDAYSISRNFSPTFKCNFLFGDIDYVPNKPSFVKSRPINNSQNSILLKLNKVRHFQYVVDNIKLENKADILFGRAAVFQKQRIDFYNKYFHHPMCDLGQINQGINHDQWMKKKASLDTHLKHKFILCIEGNDVASNLKWVMSSNSVAVMPKPKYESWFMEGKLIPNYHYILIKDDYSDLEEKLNYYKKNTDELKRIAKNANQYTNQFRDRNKEKLISLLVMEKFFKLSNQKKSSVNFLA